MCGILGFFQTRAPLDRAGRQVIGKKMAARLSHRGPDDEGLWQAEDMPLLLGHRRLSIIDLSPEGHQPKASHSRRYVISYNGEIYNFLSLQRELEAAGIRFQGRSDTEIMLAAFDHWGINQALQKFNGMFAFALWDKKTRRLHLVRDRLGKKPLYCGWAGHDLVFASELKAFHAHPKFEPRIDRQALAAYMQYGWMPAPQAIYDQVWQLLPGCRVSLALEDLTPGQDISALFEPYWHLPEIITAARHQAPFTDEEDALNELEQLLGTCVSERMVSDVPLGAFLSGGIDSSAVVALMQQRSARPVQTFTIGFEEDGFDEARYARKVADHLGTDHHELYLKPEQARDIIPQLPDIYDEPFADASQIPTCLISRFARDHVTVALTGDGGDEMFAGYSRHVVLPPVWQRLGWMPPAIRQSIAGTIYAMPAQRWTGLVKKVPRFGDKLYKLAAIISEKDETALYRTAIRKWPEASSLVKDAHDPLSDRLEDPLWEARDLNFTEQLLYQDTLTYLPDDVLTKVDRATMAVSLECRAPLLDRRMVEFAWRLPLSMKIRGGKGKWLLRTMLNRHLPASLFERPKQGFTVPIAAWLQGPLHDWAEALLDEKRLCSEAFLEPEPIRAAWQAVKEGRSDQAQKIWTVLMFQAWLEKWR